MQLMTTLQHWNNSKWLWNPKNFGWINRHISHDFLLNVPQIAPFGLSGNPGKCDCVFHLSATFTRPIKIKAFE